MRGMSGMAGLVLVVFCIIVFGGARLPGDFFVEFTSGGRTLLSEEG